MTTAATGTVTNVEERLARQQRDIDAMTRKITPMPSEDNFDLAAWQAWAERKRELGELVEERELLAESEVGARRSGGS